MLPKWHIFFGYVVSYVLVCFFEFPLIAGFAIFVSSIIIDFDHYISYAYEEKDFGIMRFWDWSMKRREKWIRLPKKEKSKYRRSVFVFHGFEFLIVIFLFSRLSVLFLWVLFGVLIHMAADFVSLWNDYEPFYVKASQACVCIKNKNKKKFVIDSAL